MMKCNDARLLMSGALDGQLNDGEMCAVNAHMEMCAACRQRWQAMQQVSNLFRTADVALPPPDFTRRVMLRLSRREYREVAAPSRSHAVALAWGAAALSVGLVLSLLVLSLSTAMGGADSASFLSLSLRVSGSAVRAATLVDSAARTAASIMSALPLTAVALLLLWLTMGTVGLAITVASLVAGYQPVAAAGRDVATR